MILVIIPTPIIIYLVLGPVHAAFVTSGKTNADDQDENNNSNNSGNSDKESYYLVSVGQTLYCLDPSDGKITWTKELT